MKKIQTIVILIFIFIIGTFIGGYVKYFNALWVADRNVNEYLSFFEPKVIDDHYGGSTPEQTFDMYLDALRKGDLELASRYFTVDKWDKRLEILKNTDVGSYIKELESIDRNNWVEEEIDQGQIGVKYTAYRFKEIDIKTINLKGDIIVDRLPVGNYNSAIIFEKNDNLWKIFLL